MIQSMSGAHAAAMAAERSGQASPSQGVIGQSAGLSSDQASMKFQADMRHAANLSNSLPFAAAMPAAAAQAADADEASAPRRDEDMAERSAADELTPEQWLLAMIDQQQVAIQARGERPMDTAAVADPALKPEQDPHEGAQEPLDAGLVSVLDTADKQAVAADPLMAMAEQGRQASRFAASTNVASPRVTETSAAPADVLTGKSAAHALLDPAMEQLRPAAEQIEAGDPLASVDRGQAPQNLATDRGLKLQGPEAKWGEQMLHALRENVDLQIQQKIQSATIRLDPPELGSMEILLSHESGRLNVQLTAANADVARLLQQTSDRLRQELVGQHFVQVNVQVGADGGGQQGQQRQRAALTGEELPTAARNEEQTKTPEGQRGRDVLITV
jgi:flagellar hook-length control protein FliK